MSPSTSKEQHEHQFQPEGGQDYQAGSDSFPKFSAQHRNHQHHHQHHDHDNHDHDHHHGHDNHFVQEQMQQQFQDQMQQQRGRGGSGGGQATLQPDNSGGAFSNAGSGHDALNAWIRSNLYIMVIVAVVVIIAFNKLYTWYLDWSSRRQVANVASMRSAGPQQQQNNNPINDGLRQARERQMQAVKEAQKRDAELREQRRLEDIAERERKMKERQQQIENGELAEGGAALGFTERLPTLPSGNNYRPSDTWNTGGGGGGRYRPTGFCRPRRGGG